MIVDTLDHLTLYTSLNPLFDEAVKFIKEHDLSKLENGKHLIRGKELFVNITDAEGKTEAEATFETHRRMLDIQIPLDNDEAYGYIPTAKLPEAAYNEEKDVTKYPGVTSPTIINCKPGEFAIFFPQDGHKPCIGKGKIHKAIFKVSV